MNRSFYVHLFDFEDSFTYNIATTVASLRLREVELKIYTLSQTKDFFLSGKYLALKKRCVFIYGPGPGHPDRHGELFADIRRSIDNPCIFHLGICLGHQLLWRIFGYSITRVRPVHGRSIAIALPCWAEFDAFKDCSSASKASKIRVQRYNSLSVVVDEGRIDSTHEFFFHQKQCMGGRFPRGLTYQFHPESVGTERQRDFFGVVASFLYNNYHEGQYYSH